MDAFDMHVSQLEALIDGHEHADYISARFLSFNAPVELQREINTDSQNSHPVSEKSDTDDEIIAEYIFDYLCKVNGQLDLETSISILEDIFFVFDAFHSTYILNMNSYKLGEKTDKNNYEIISSAAYDLGSKIDKNMRIYWNNFVDEMKSGFKNESNTSKGNI